MTESPVITVFTPTYNRISTLGRTYDSLCTQTYKNFIWLIIDDGSSDGTEEIVRQWIEAGKIQIEYHFKENGGMHTAHNLAYSLIKTELNVCIDSDDFMPADAIEKINSFWIENKNLKFSGIVALNADLNNKIIGSKLPETIKSSTLGDIYNKHGVRGDKKLVYRSEVTREFPPYPEYKNEKLVPLSYKYKLIDQKYELLIMNEVICNVDYQEHGSSNTILKQYFQSPRGFAEYRKLILQYSPYFKEKLIAAIHYVAGSIILKNRDFLKESPAKGLTVIATPIGAILYIILRFIVERTKRRGQS